MRQVTKTFGILIAAMILNIPQLFAQLISHHNPLFMPAFPKPAIGVPYTDPVFGTTVRRITNAVTSGNQGTVPHYSKRQLWNNNDSLMILINGDDGYFSLFNGQTYQFIRYLDDPMVYGDDVFWHPLNNNIIVYTPGNTIYSYNVATNEQTVIRTFPEYEWCNSMGEGNLSYDGRYYAMVGRTYDTTTCVTSKKHILVYDFELDSVVTRFALPPDSVMGDFDWVSISPLGNYVVIEFADEVPGRYHGVEVFDRNMNFLRRLGSGSGHSDLGLDDNGDEIYVKVIYFAEDTISVERAYKYRLSDGATTALLDVSDVFTPHVSMQCVNLWGWCVISIFDNFERLTDDSLSWMPFEDEIFALRLNGSGDVRRIAHHHSRRTSPVNWNSDTSEYWAEPHATVNRAGNKVVWGSNWRENISYPWAVDSYLADFYIPSVIPVSRQVQNLIIPASQNRCYNASSALSVAGNGSTFIVQNSGSVDMISGQKINLLAGTHVHQGGYLHCHITTNGQFCNNPPPLSPGLMTEVDSKQTVIEESGIRAYPNPTSGNVNIEVEYIHPNQSITIQVYNSLGEAISQSCYHGKSDHEVQLASLPPGIYLIRTISGDKMKTIRVLKR